MSISAEAVRAFIDPPCSVSYDNEMIRVASKLNRGGWRPRLILVRGKAC